MSPRLIKFLMSLSCRGINVLSLLVKQPVSLFEALTDIKFNFPVYWYPGFTYTVVVFLFVCLSVRLFCYAVKLHHNHFLTPPPQKKNGEKKV